MDKNHSVIAFISKKFFSRRPRVAIFADIIKIITMFINPNKTGEGGGGETISLACMFCFITF